MVKSTSDIGIWFVFFSVVGMMGSLSIDTIILAPTNKRELSLQRKLSDVRKVWSPENVAKGSRFIIYA